MEILESQLSAYGKSMTEDRLRDETQRLMGEKEEYQEVAKKTLKRLSDEKLEAVRRQKDLEKDLAAAEQELAVLREMYERDSAEGQRLAEQVVKLAQELEEVKKKVPPEEEEKKTEEEGEDAASKNAQTDSSGGSEMQKTLEPAQAEALADTTVASEEQQNSEEKGEKSKGLEHEDTVRQESTTEETSPGDPQSLEKKCRQLEEEKESLLNKVNELQS